MRKMLVIAALAPFLLGLRCGSDSRATRQSRSGGYGSADECDGQRKQNLAMCTFKRQTGCGDVMHTLDGTKDGIDWWRVEGCGQHLDCVYSNDDETRMRCAWPHDVDDAKARLAIESGCSEGQLEATAQQRIYRCSHDEGPGCGWSMRVLVSVAWRLSGCGRAFACTASYESGDEEEPIETSALKGVDCKPALDQPVAAQPQVAPQAIEVAAPPPLEACSPSTCPSGCCLGGVCILANMSDRQCGFGGVQCANCAADGRKCSAKYTCVP